MAFYNVNKDSLSPDKRPHYAFSLFSSSDIELNDCLTQTITPEDELMEKKDVMRCRMEAFITNLQGKIIKKLQTYEPEQKFLVDRWLRKEVSLKYNKIKC